MDREHRWIRGRRHNPVATVLAVAVLASFVAFLDGSVVNLALPAISADFGGGSAVGIQNRKPDLAAMPPVVSASCYDRASPPPANPRR